MYLKQYGTGTEVYVGLHGWSGDHTTFAPLAAHLPAEATLYSADLPGCGQSAPPASWDLPSITAEISLALTKLTPAPVTLIGNCSGALLSLLVAQRLPSVHRLVLLDPFAYWPWYFKVFVAPGWGKYAYFATFANPLGRWLTNTSLHQRRTEKTHLTQSFAGINHTVAHRYLMLLTSITSPNQFQHLRLPIDIIYGTRTFQSIKKSAALWRARWPQACCWEIPGAGHLPLEEATVALSRIIFDQTLMLDARATSGVLPSPEYTLGKQDVEI
jgi:pimeloyl-ACP methyl ester carboxylesterase